MEIALFIVYLAAVSFVLSAIPFFKNSKLGRGRTLILFYVKVLAGVAYARFYSLPKYYADSDTWRFYRLSLVETKWLKTDPVAFAKDLFIYGYGRPGNLFAGENSYWNDLKSNIPVKIMAMMNLLTRNSYYVDIILFNLLFFIGLIAIFRVLLVVFPTKKWLIVIGVFLLPSTLFWCSGVHKDGLILSAIGIMIYSFYKIITVRATSKHLVILLLASILIFSLRNYILFALLPALFCWWLSEKYPQKKNLIFLSVYFVGILIFFLVPYILPSVNLPLYFSLKQKEFLLLPADSAVKIPLLQPSFSGFISFFPYALDMAFFRPHFNEMKNLSYLPAVFETLVLIILTLFAVISVDRRKALPPIVLFLLSFSITILLISGYTIPYTGAVVRYRSIALPFLITPLLCISNFSAFERRRK